MGRFWILAGGGLAFFIVMTARPDPGIFIESQRGQIGQESSCGLQDVGCRSIRKHQPFGRY